MRIEKAVAEGGSVDENKLIILHLFIFLLERKSSLPS